MSDRWCFPSVPVLPAIYERALSYEEQICVLAGRVELIKNQLDTLDLNGIQQQLNAFHNELMSFENSMNAQYAQFAAKYTADILALQNNINTQAAAMNAGNKAYTDNIAAELRSLIDQMESDFNNIVIYNPYKGFTTTLQQWIEDNSAMQRRCAVTAGEYDALHWAAEKYDSKRITALQYDYNFKCMFFDAVSGIYSPFTGTRDSVQNIINKLASLHYTGYNAQQYDGFDLTAQGYDNKQISAYDYNFSAWNMEV